MDLPDRKTISFCLNGEAYSDSDPRFFLLCDRNNESSLDDSKYFPVDLDITLAATEVKVQFDSASSFKFKEYKKDPRLEKANTPPRWKPQFDDLVIYKKSYSLEESTRERIEISLRMPEHERRRLYGGIGAFDEEEYFERFHLTVYRQSTPNPTIGLCIRNSFYELISNEYESPKNCVVEFHKSLEPKHFDSLKNSFLAGLPDIRLTVGVTGLGGIYSRSQFGLRGYKALIFRKHLVTGAEDFFNKFPEMRLKTYFDIGQTVTGIKFYFSSSVKISSHD
jgi:hypothetical protein